MTEITKSCLEIVFFYGLLIGAAVFIAMILGGLGRSSPRDDRS